MRSTPNMQSMLLHARGVWGHAPRKILKNICYEITYESIFCQLAIHDCLHLMYTSVCLAQNAQVTLHSHRQLTPFVDSVAIANRKVCDRSHVSVADSNVMMSLSVY